MCSGFLLLNVQHLKFCWSSILLSLFLQIYPLKKISLLTLLTMPYGMWDISSPQRIQLEPPDFKAQSLNHCTAREVPHYCLFSGTLEVTSGEYMCSIHQLYGESCKTSLFKNEDIFPEISPLDLFFHWSEWGYLLKPKPVTDKGNDVTQIVLYKLQFIPWG